MNTWQILRQLKHKLTALTWADSPAQAVFSNVKITDVPARNLIGLLRHPFCIIHSPSSTGSKENPSKLDLSLDIEIYHQNEGDRFGENILLGGMTTLTGISPGKGILQIQQELFSNADILGREDGVRHYSIIRSGRSEAQIDNDVAREIRLFTLDLGIWEEETYTDVHNFAGSQSGADVPLTWEDPPDRFDRYQVVVVRKTGSDPTSSTDGTNIGTLAIGAQTVTDSGAPVGEQHYGAFASYDKTLVSTPATATDFSDGKFKTVTVV